MEFFQNLLIRKYCIVFGTFFNDVVIKRTDPDDPAKSQKFLVPIEFGPREKYLGMTNAKPDEKKRAIQLPRMSFEMTGMEFDATRKIERRHEIHDGSKKILRGAPWNIHFQLSVMTYGMLDATKIVEQVLFMFQPDFTVDVKLLEGFNHIDRISTVYNNVQHEDIYTNNFEERRYTVWTIDFTMKAWLYGPIDQGKQIKLIDLTFHPDIDPNSYFEEITIQPGLTIDGNPTTDINETIPYQDIEETDNYGIIQLDYPLRPPADD